MEDDFLMGQLKASEETVAIIQVKNDKDVNQVSNSKGGKEEIDLFTLSTCSYWMPTICKALFLVQGIKW